MLIRKTYCPDSLVALVSENGAGIDVISPCEMREGATRGAGEFERSKGNRATSARRVVSVNDRGYVIGQDHHRAKLSDHDIWLIFELRADGMSYSDLAEKFEVSKSAIARICRGEKRGQTAVGQRRLPPSRPRMRFRPANPDEFDTVYLGD